MNKTYSKEELEQAGKTIQHLKELERTVTRYMQRWEEKILDIEKGREEGRQEGEARQIVKMGLEFGLPMTDILTRLQEQLNISLSEAEEYFCHTP